MTLLFPIIVLVLGVTIITLLTIILKGVFTICEDFERRISRLEKESLK
jgi:uncharacterized membrane protein (Fun14 family)